MCLRVEYKGDLEGLLRGLPEADDIRKYFEVGGAFYLDQNTDYDAKAPVEIFFYLYDGVQYFYVDRGDILIHE